jgi:hypothetical protein
MANRGEAADYYTGAPTQDNQYKMQEPNYGQQQPPQYGQGYPPPQGPPPNGNQPSYGEKMTFDQQFAVPKPKFNDWWAGILVSWAYIVFLSRYRC